MDNNAVISASSPQAITVAQLNQRLSDAIAATPGLRNVWVIGETSDLRLSGGNCYFELLQKDDNGNTVAKIRATCWATQWRRICAEFLAITGTQPSSGIKVMMCVSASYHPAYGMSVNVSAINAEFTLGDAVRHRNEIIRRLQQNGLLELNRNVRWTMPPQNIAVISAPGAAGYGDFINQLYTNPYHIRYRTKLFPAIMQGDRTVPSVSAALLKVAAADRFDCVVIIRGGGATSDLAAFDNYDLAAAVARFPIPVVVGIGHERDITVLDYVANMRVKTPTAAAEWFIARGKRMLDALDNAAAKVSEAAKAHIEGNRRQLAVINASLPGIVQSAIAVRRQQNARLSLALADMLPRLVTPQRRNLDKIAADLQSITNNSLTRNNLRLQQLSEALSANIDASLKRHHEKINTTEALIRALSPEKILSRGFSITYADGKPVTDAANLAVGTRLTTRFANGSANSTVTPE